MQAKGGTGGRRGLPGETALSRGWGLHHLGQGFGIWGFALVRRGGLGGGIWGVAAFGVQSWGLVPFGGEIWGFTAFGAVIWGFAPFGIEIWDLGCGAFASFGALHHLWGP